MARAVQVSHTVPVSGHRPPTCASSGEKTQSFGVSQVDMYANRLTNAVRHEFVMIANDRQTFVAVRKHSRSFLWCFECYAGLTHQWRMYGEWAYECNSPMIAN